MKIKRYGHKIALLLLSAGALVGLYQNCSPSFSPLEGAMEISQSLDPFVEEAPITFPGPAPKIIEAKILGDVPYPVFLEESGAIITRDPLISWRFRRVMGDAKFKKLGNVLTNGTPSVFCAILESAQPRCMGKILGVDVSELPDVPEPVVDVVGSPQSLFALSASGGLYFLQLQGNLQWVKILQSRTFAKIIPFSPVGMMYPNASGQFVVLTTLEKPGNVGFVVHSAAAQGVAMLRATDLSFAPSLFPGGATDIGPSSKYVAALYEGSTVKFCPDRTAPLVQGEISPCWDATLPSSTQRLWSENPNGRAGCVLNSEKHPYCFIAARETYAGGAPRTVMRYLGASMGAWSNSFQDVSKEPMESIHFSTETAVFLVMVSPSKDATVFVQQSERLGADLFSRLGYTKTQYEKITLTFKWIQFGKDVGLYNGRICGPDPTGVRFMCVMPVNWSPDFGMPNSAKFMTSFVGLTDVAKIYGAKAPLPRSGKFMLGNDDVVYAQLMDPGIRLMPVLSAPGAKYLRCSGNNCQIDFENGTSRVDDYVEKISFYPGASLGYVSSYEVVPLSGAKLPNLNGTQAQFGGLSLEERLNVEGNMCGVSSGQLVCLERVSGQATMTTQSLPPTSNVLDHRAYFGKSCLISSNMRLSCLVATGGTPEFREVAMREPATRFFGTPVYQGASGRFYGLREISPGVFGDYELRFMPPADQIANVVLPRTDMSAWQALSSNGEQGVVIETTDGACQYRGMDTNEPIAGPLPIDVRRFY